MTDREQSHPGSDQRTDEAVLISLKLAQLYRERDRAPLRYWGELSREIEETMGGRPPTRAA